MAKVEPDYEAAQKKYGSEGSWSRLDLRDGENDVRILPKSAQAATEGDADPYGFVVRVHFIPQKSGKKRMVRCAKELDTFQECPVCEWTQELKDSEDPDDQAMAKQVKAKKMYWFNALDMESPTGVLVLQCGPELGSQNIQKHINPKWGHFIDIDDGHNWTITKTPAAKSGKGRVEYTGRPDPDRTSVREILEEIEDWEKQLDALEEMLPRIPSAEDYESLIEGDDWPERETQAAPSRRRKPKSVVQTPKKQGTAKEQKAPAVEASKPAKKAGKRSAKKKDEATAIAEEAFEQEGAEVSTPPKAGPSMDCFGQDYKPRATRCRDCAQREKCWELFIAGDE